MRNVPAGAIDLPPAIACEHPTNGLVVFLEKLAPAQVAEPNEVVASASTVTHQTNGLRLEPKYSRADPRLAPVLVLLSGGA